MKRHQRRKIDPSKDETKSGVSLSMLLIWMVGLLWMGFTFILRGQDNRIQQEQQQQEQPYER